jgi:hypothetical protein
MVPVFVLKAHLEDEHSFCSVETLEYYILDAKGQIHRGSKVLKDLL